jgi:hypothetical protein
MVNQLLSPSFEERMMKVLRHFAMKAIFSMSFFNFPPGGKDQAPPSTVSERFWIYWITTIPTTAVVMILGLAWLRIFARKAFPM